MEVSWYALSYLFAPRCFRSVGIALGASPARRIGKVVVEVFPDLPKGVIGTYWTIPVTYRLARQRVERRGNPLVPLLNILANTALHFHSIPAFPRGIPEGKPGVVTRGGTGVPPHTFKEQELLFEHGQLNAAILVHIVRTGIRNGWPHFTVGVGKEPGAVCPALGQGPLDRVHAPLGKLLVVGVGRIGVRVPVQADLHLRVPRHVRGHGVKLVIVARFDHRFVVVEEDIPVAHRQGLGGPAGRRARLRVRGGS